MLALGTVQKALHNKRYFNKDLTDNSPFSSSRDTTVQNLAFTRQTTDITQLAVVFHCDVINN